MNLMEEAQSLLLHQFTHSPKLNALLKCLVKPLPEVLEEVEKLHHGHYIDRAFGQSLDVMGALVNQPRLGMSDDDYKPWIKIAILRITNGGTAPGIFAIMKVLYKKNPPVKLNEYPPNHIYLTLFELPNIPMPTFAAIIKCSMPIGSDVQFIMATNHAGRDNNVNIANTKANWPSFQFDVTSFSQSCFADFYI